MGSVVHFPDWENRISDTERFGRRRIYSDREATPGKFLPSSSSREAPPPVDT